MNAWLWCGLVLLGCLLPLGIAALRRPAVEGLAALQVAGADASLAFFVLAVGIERTLFVDLSLMLAILSFAGTLAFAAVLERRP